MKCPKCDKEYDFTIHRPIYNYNGQKTCRVCSQTEENFHIDRIEITEVGPVLVQPFCVDDLRGRDRLVEFIYLLFDRKQSTRAFSQIKQYEKKGYTYLGMIRALEYFFIIKKNSLAKAKGGIGIVPHIYDEAQKYYAKKAEAALSQAQKWYKFKPDEAARIVVKKEERQNPQMGMDVADFWEV